MKITIVGYGSIAQALIPILLSEFEADLSMLRIIAPDAAGASFNTAIPIVIESVSINQSNYQKILCNIEADCFLINVSIDVCSLSLVELCQAKGAKYLDTCIEPWAGGYVDASLGLAERTNYALRNSLLSRRASFVNGPTAIIAHGANPGMVSHFVKQALINLHVDIYGFLPELPKQQMEWAALANQLNIKTIHIAEHDTQTAVNRKQENEFVNTWSVDGLIAEGFQPVELGWGTHERSLPPQGKNHTTGSFCSIYLERPGVSLRVKTWTPAKGPCLGYAITHNESISIADYLTLRSRSKVIYRPTVNYAYHPCDDAVLSIHDLSACYSNQKIKRVLKGHEIASGADYLGVLLMGHERNAYWYGSVLTNETAQRIDTALSATSLQVVAGIVSGIHWAIENPNRGIIEADEMDFQSILNNAKPYLGELRGVYTDWTPRGHIESLFPSNSTQAWQFSDFME